MEKGSIKKKKNSNRQNTPGNPQRRRVVYHKGDTGKPRAVC